MNIYLLVEIKARPYDHLFNKHLQMVAFDYENYCFPEYYSMTHTDN